MFIQTVFKKNVSVIQKLLFLSIGLFLIVSAAEAASTRDGAELTRTFDAYNSASRAGKVDKILSFYPAEYRRDVRRDIAIQENRRAFLLYSRTQVPEAYEVQHMAWSRDGRRAKLYLLSRFSAMPEINRTTVRMEQAVSFVREKGIGKIESTTLIVDPETIKRPQDMLFNRDDVDRERDADISGRIVRTEFMKDHTLVIVRVRDEEHAVFLPPAEALLEAGVPLDELKPWSLYEFWGSPHKSDRLKFFGNGGRKIDD